MIAAEELRLMDAKEVSASAYSKPEIEEIQERPSGRAAMEISERSWEISVEMWRSGCTVLVDRACAGVWKHLLTWYSGIQQHATTRFHMSMFRLNHPIEHGARTDRGKEGDGTYTAIWEGVRLDDAMACGHVAAPWSAGH